MARVNKVKAARKAQGNCGSCGKPILPGDPYSWTKPRYGSKKVRCSSCKFRQSDLTSSDKLSRLYSAAEALEDSADNARRALEAFAASTADQAATYLENFVERLTELKDELETQMEEVRSVSEEYQESADNILEYFTSGTELSEELESNSYEVESWADEMDIALDEVAEAIELASSRSTRAAIKYLATDQLDAASADSFTA